VFFVGSLVRFDREQYTWKSDSSQLLRAGQLRLGSNLFHIGVLGVIGAILLVQRRLGDVRILRHSSPMDIFILLLLMAQLGLGLLTIPVSLQHMDGAEMIKLVEWAQHIWTFRGGAADFLADVSILFKLHLFSGLTVFLIFPFTRLVHIWSGFAAIGYLTRAYQLVRAR